jgi:hypothetical protein
MQGEGSKTLKLPWIPEGRQLGDMQVFNFNLSSSKFLQFLSHFSLLGRMMNSCLLLPALDPVLPKTLGVPSFTRKASDMHPMPSDSLQSPDLDQAF